MKNLFWRFAVMAAAVCVWGGPAAAQELRSTLLGRVLDPQSAPVAGAAVAVTNANTNVTVRLQTNETGYYEARLLLPGQYAVRASAPGFKESVRGGIVLAGGIRLTADVRLEIGAVTESIVVEAAPPVLETSGVWGGRVMDSRTLSDIPIFYNNTTDLIRYTPGVFTGGQNATSNALHATGGFLGTSIGGGVGSNAVSLDGAPNMRRATPGDAPSYNPHSDTVQEVKIETFSFDAAVGHTTGINVAMLTKVGTNQFHGTVSNQHWQQRWNGSPFFVKQQYYRNIAQAEARGDAALAGRLRAQDKQPSGHSNNYNAAIGGPVILPKLYDGRDKLFFFFSYTGLKFRASATPAQINRTVPTLANRKGDFSALLNVDASGYQIYDPLTVRPDPARPTHYIRSPLAGNIVPQSRIINPVYPTYLGFLPTPNNDPMDPRAEPLNNYVATAMKQTWDYKALSNRIDYQHSNTHRFFFRWVRSTMLSQGVDWMYETTPGLVGSKQWWPNEGATLDWVYLINSGTVLNVTTAENYYTEGDKPPEAATRYTPSAVGLPSYLDAKAGDLAILPLMSVSGYSALGPFRRGYPQSSNFRMASTKANISHVRGHHTLRGGFDMRHQFRSTTRGGNTSGNFGFTNGYTSRNDDGFTPTRGLAHGWAAFMMGLPAAMTIDTNDTYITYSPSYGWFVQDDFRVTPKLTLNLGVRLEHERGPTERFNRMIGPFDTSLTLPISEAAQSAYAGAPVPERASSGFIVRGGSVYAGTSGVGRRIWGNETMWMPRLGAAYQLDSKTVLRGGYGIYHDSLNAWTVAPNQLGFSRTTSTPITNDFGMTWLVGDPARGVSPMVDPFPVRSDGTRFDMPLATGLGSMAVAGTSFRFNEINPKRSRQQRWRLGVQRQLDSSTAVEIAYGGTRSDRVYIGGGWEDNISVIGNLNALPENYWADGLRRDNAIASNLGANVTNPFSIGNFAALRSSHSAVYQAMNANAFFTRPTIGKAQLLRPFPHMPGLTVALDPVGKVRTDELQLNLERRFSKHFSLMLSYVRFRNRAADIFLNEFDPEPAWREGSIGRPHRLTGMSVIELPFGKGRKFLTAGLPSKIFGGFQLGVNYEFQPGPLIRFGNLFYYAEPSAIASGSRSLSQWFNTANFERTPANGPAAYHRRVFPLQVDGVRADGVNLWNANVQRDFRITERVAFQLRAEALNLQNRSQFAAPDVNPFSTNFGKVTSQTPTYNRFLQFQARVKF